MEFKEIDYEIELIINKRLYELNIIPKSIYKKVNDKIIKLKEKLINNR